VQDEATVIQPDVRRYLVAGTADGPVVTLRGHEMFIPRLLQVIGGLALVACAVGLWGIVTSPGDEIPLGIAIVAGPLGVGSLAYAWWRLRHPNAVLVIDKAQATLTIRRGNLAPRVIAFRDLGTMKLGAVTTVIMNSHTGGRERIRHAVIGLSQHPDVILYDPWNDGDLNCFAVTLRHLVGEEFLPRAQPKPAAPT
jgi:hypothetical protein